MTVSPDRGSAAVSVPMSSGTGMSPSFGVAAPIGAVSRRTRDRARATSLQPDGPSSFVLRTALAGHVSLQRRGVDGAWETLSRRRTSRRGRTRIDLPQPATARRPVFRVVFAPRSPHLTPWISGDLGA